MTRLARAFEIAFIMMWTPPNQRESENLNYRVEIGRGEIPGPDSQAAQQTGDRFLSYAAKNV